jgi:adenylate cyclase
MASEATMTQTGDAFAWRELDAIRVLGRGEAIKVFEPLADKGMESDEQKKVAAAYGAGLARWRAREFAEAVEAFEGAGTIDPASALFAKRARALAAKPPPAEWTPVNTLEGK